jgi:hypothetical protein
MRNLLIIVFLLLSPSVFADEKEEEIKQVIEIAQSKAIIKKQRLETPPNIKWDNTVPLRYKGTINRHNQKSGLNFGFTQNLSQGIFYYNFNNIFLGFGHVLR